jgi:hypothetical protein
MYPKNSLGYTISISLQYPNAYMQTLIRLVVADFYLNRTRLVGLVPKIGEGGARDTEF